MAHFPPLPHNILLTFGAPHVLQSDNGREFTAGIITELASLWPDLILVNGRPRYPQSQGSVERGNCTLKDSLVAWMRDNKTATWSYGLDFVQWGVNTTYHEAIKMTPYEAVFGKKHEWGWQQKYLENY
ncbi:PREDICTED: KRAB-A domain-containing protein 2-like [Diuraphis noxia]|uniref:KRAB-A domain-containing protein 2-like n=1 Tax=Diuraphis noxia TaxID=143948 RepID=UPI0007635F62|nr:PREDICTED: KRAB-A domain-containing protein 2-like [Diuraphis noxia]